MTEPIKDDFSNIHGLVIASTIKKARERNFTKVPNEFIMSKDFTLYEKMIWIVLKKYLMSHETCWPGIAAIARCAGCSESTVKKAIKGLEIKRMIKRSNSAAHRSNTYHVFSTPQML
jgi:DNA-binding MarR family transcriptional regulator